MSLSTSSIATLDSVERLTAVLRARGHRVEIGIAADTGAIYMRVDGKDHPVGVLVVTGRDDSPEIAAPSPTIH